MQDVLSSEFLRIYTSNDTIGVEIGGAIKNVIAVCAGISDGLGLGDNHNIDFEELHEVEK